MNQTSAIAGSLIVAFIVFVTVRGELPCYMQVLGIATDSACPVGTASGTASSVSSGNRFVAGGSSGVGVCGSVNGLGVCTGPGGTRVGLPPITIGGGSGGGINIGIGGGSGGFGGFGGGF